MTRSPSPTRRSRFWGALALTVALGVAACSGTGADSSSGSGDEAATGGAGSVGVQGTAPGTDRTGTEPPGTDQTGTMADPAVVDPAVAARAVVSTATISVRVDDVAAALDAVESRALAAGGLVGSSSTGGPDGSGSAHLTLRVPSAEFDAVLDDVADLGQQTDRTTGSTDVTAEVADVDSRVVSAQAVLDGFRQRLPEARTVSDVLALEGEIARRQADLEALQARQRVLADQVSLSRIDVDLTRGAPVAVEAATQPGFLGGLIAGWHALGEFARVLALVVGAVLPFAVPSAIVGVPVWVLLRRRRTRTMAGPSTPAPSE